MWNPKTVAGLILLGILLVVLGILIGRMIPTIGAVQLEMSLTPTPEPAWPDTVMAVTPDPSLPTAEPVLRNGMKGQNVKDLQSRLYTLGYYTGEIDGQFGAATKEAVLAFQRRNGLGADGIVGEETRSRLFSAEARPFVPEAPTATPSPSPEGDPAGNAGKRSAAFG